MAEGVNKVIPVFFHKKHCILKLVFSKMLKLKPEDILNYGESRSLWLEQPLGVAICRNACHLASFLRSVGGLRGAVESNVLRYYLAILAYMDTLKIPVEQRFEKRISQWYDLTARYKRQLFDARPKLF